MFYLILFYCSNPSEVCLMFVTYSRLLVSFHCEVNEPEIQKKGKVLKRYICMFMWWVTVGLRQRHDECAEQEPTECTCGPLRDHILPPWAIYPVIKVQCYPRAHLKHMYNTNTACHADAKKTSAQGCFLLLVKPHHLCAYRQVRGGDIFLCPQKA